MPQGFQSWDESGALHIDITTRLSRTLGVAQTGVSNGSVTNADFSQGAPWWVLVPIGNAFSYIAPAISYNASTRTLSWARPASGTAAFSNCLLIYGVY